jgi:hypothetical protein
MFCTQCGTPNADGVTFCSQCGASLNAAAIPPTQPPVYQQPIYQQQTPSPYGGYGSAGRQTFGPRPGWKLYLPVICGSLALLAFFVLPWITLVFILSVTGFNMAARTGLIGLFMTSLKQSMAYTSSYSSSTASISSAYNSIAAGFGLLWLVPVGALLSFFVLKRDRWAKILPLIGGAIGLLGLILYTILVVSGFKALTSGIDMSDLSYLLGDAGYYGSALGGSLFNFAGFGFILTWLCMAGQVVAGYLASKEISMMYGI